MTSNEFDHALKNGAQGERLTEKQAFALVQTPTADTLQELGQAAHANRVKRFDHNATYVFNLHVNPSNICSGSCAFCQYRANPRDAHAFVLEEEEIFSRVKNLAPTEVHIVGGLNEIWHYSRNLDLVKTLRRKFPNLFIKGFTAVEIDYFSQSEKTSPKAILEQLADAGLEALPGGGAEIFDDALRKRYWPKKIGPKRWLEIHRTAHRLGLKSNATMLFGLGETWEHRIRHLLALRDAQDATSGFECFIPLAFIPGRGAFSQRGPGPLEMLQVLSVARLVLDNISHLKSYWPTLGLETAAAGLGYGADDMDGTISQETIMQLSGSTTPKGLAREKMELTIREAGFHPLERDGRFHTPN